MMNNGVFSVWASLLRRLTSVWRPMFAVNLAYGALGIVLLAPLPGVVARLLMHLSGTDAIADQDIVRFLLTPYGIASFVLVLGIVVAIGALAQASLLFIGIEGTGRRPSALDALLFATRRVVSILDFSVQLVARVLIRTVPFLAVGAATAWLLIGDHDINYYLAERPPAFWTAGTIIACLLAVMVVVVVRKLIGWSLALPLVLGAGISPRRSFAESERLVHGQRSMVLGVLVIWALIAVALGALVVALVRGLGALIVPGLFDTLPLLVIALGGLVALWVVLSFLATFFNAATFALGILELAERLGAPIGSARASADALPARPSSAAGGVIPRVAAALAGAAVVAVLTGAWLVNGVELPDDVTVVAHRGAAGKAPENTLAALRQAIEDGADWIEIDVQETVDGEVVVVHDSDFMKLSGVPLKVRDGTLEQIRGIDVGSWFDPRFAGERVPTLREVLEMARGRSRVVIELKYYGYDHMLEQRVVDTVEATGMAADVAIMSLEYEGIRKIRALRPDWTIGLLAARAIGDLTALDTDFVAVNSGMANARLIRRAASNGKQLFVWTLNDPVSMSRMMTAGVDGIITDEPEMARMVIEQRAAMGPVERLLVHTAVLFGRPLPARVYRDDSP